MRRTPAGEGGSDLRVFGAARQSGARLGVSAEAVSTQQTLCSAPADVRQCLGVQFRVARFGGNRRDAFRGSPWFSPWARAGARAIGIRTVLLTYPQVET